MYMLCECIKNTFSKKKKKNVFCLIVFRPSVPEPLTHVSWVCLYIIIQIHYEVNLGGMEERQISGSQWLRADLKPVEDVISIVFFVDFY